MLTEHFDILHPPEGYQLPKAQFTSSLTVSGQASQRHMGVFPANLGSLDTSVFYLFAVQSRGAIFNQGSEFK